ncbi:MAG: hypothetical protein OWQ50_01155 [Acidianus infernus]|nr:hypothetical protein [Acidianus infernus]
MTQTVQKTQTGEKTDILFSFTHLFDPEPEENKTQQETQTAQGTQQESTQETQQLTPQLKHLMFVDFLAEDYCETFKPNYIMYITENIVRFVGISKGRHVVVYKHMAFKRTRSDNLGIDHFENCVKAGRIIDVIKLTDIEFNLDREDVVVINYYRNSERREIVIGKEIDDALAYLFSRSERLMIYDTLLNYAL